MHLSKLRVAADSDAATIRYIEWTADEVSLETALELVELSKIITRWKFQWETVWDSPEERAVVAAQCQEWSDKLL